MHLATVNRTTARALVYVRSSAPDNAVDLQISYDATKLTPRALQYPTKSGLVTIYAPQPACCAWP